MTALLVFLVALGSFALSYNALQDMATGNGITGWLSYIWPLLIDFSLIVFSLSVVNAYLQSESTWKQWSLVGIYTVATIGFNVAHAPNNLLAQIVAAIAPVSLFFSFELLMGQLRNSVKKHGITRSIGQLNQRYQAALQDFDQLTQQATEVTQEIDTLTQKRDNLIAEIDTVSESRKRLDMIPSSANDTTFKPGDLRALSRANDSRRAKIKARREQVSVLSEQGMSQSEMANELGVSLATIKRDTKALNGRAS
jgi:DNA-binding transcriptional regulator YiaG